MSAEDSPPHPRIRVQKQVAAVGRQSIMRDTREPIIYRGFRTYTIEKTNVCSAETVSIKRKNNFKKELSLAFPLNAPFARLRIRFFYKRELVVTVTIHLVRPWPLHYVL